MTANLKWQIIIEQHETNNNNIKWPYWCLFSHFFFLEKKQNDSKRQTRILYIFLQNDWSIFCPFFLNVKISTTKTTKKKINDETINKNTHTEDFDYLIMMIMMMTMIENKQKNDDHYDDDNKTIHNKQTHTHTMNYLHVCWGRGYKDIIWNLVFFLHLKFTIILIIILWNDNNDVYSFDEIREFKLLCSICCLFDLLFVKLCSLFLIKNFNGKKMIFFENKEQNLFPNW